jgi:hypothetical protein
MPRSGNRSQTKKTALTPTVPADQPTGNEHLCIADSIAPPKRQGRPPGKKALPKNGTSLLVFG